MKRKRILSLLCLFSLLLSLFFPLFRAESALAADYTQAQVLQTYGFEDLAAEHSLLVDVNTGIILYDQLANERAYPASCTKLMTALLVLEAVANGQLTMDQLITADASSQDGLTEDSSTQDIAEGEEMSVQNLLYCLLLASANEAANILAVAVSGSISAFVDAMNAKAAELGCTGTHFCNPHGLHNEEHYTTAWDLYQITLAVWQYPSFQEIVGTAHYTVPATNLHEERELWTSNLLMPERGSEDYAYPYAVGGKTGTTNAAGRCLVSIAQKDGRTLIAVVLGTENVEQEDGTIIRTVFQESRRLLEHGFNDYHVVSLASVGTALTEVPVTGGAKASVGAAANQDISLLLPADTDASSFTYSYNLPESLEAPVSAGTVLGTVDIANDTYAYTVELVAAADVEAASAIPETYGDETQTPETESVSTEAPQTQVQGSASMRRLAAIVFAAAVLLLLLIVLITLHRRRVQRRRRRRGKRVKK